MHAQRLRGLLAAIACMAAGSSEAFAQDVADRKICPGDTVLSPSGNEAVDIQFAIRKGGKGSTIVLAGDYLIDTTIELSDGVSLCSIKGATLKWKSPHRAGMMINATRANGTTIKNLVLEGRGIAIKGSRHTIEGNLIRDIEAHSDAKHRWGERHGILVVDRADHVAIKNNFLTNIVDTGIMAYGLDQSTIADNSFQNVFEGIHLWSAQHTLVRKNTGQGFKAMSIEVQGDNLPGLIVEHNSFGKWHKDHEKGAYAMSVVAGTSAIVRQNTLEGSPLMAAGLEVGGRAPRVLANTLIDAGIIITDTPDALIKDNVLTRAGIIKDVNRAPHGTLTIQDNTITDAPRVAIFADHWWGHDQVTISGNRISKQINADTVDFVGILASDFNKQPLLITNNQISIKPANKARPVRAVCIANAGYQGNMRGMVVTNNSCDGGGVGLFGDSNSLGGHIGVIYRDNKLSNLKDTIQGDTQGLVSSGNQLINVAADQARLKDR